MAGRLITVATSLVAHCHFLRLSAAHCSAQPLSARRARQPGRFGSCVSKCPSSALRCVAPRCVALRQLSTGVCSRFQNLCSVLMHSCTLALAHLLTVTPVTRSLAHSHPLTLPTLLIHLTSLRAREKEGQISFSRCPRRLKNQQDYSNRHVFSQG